MRGFSAPLLLLLIACLLALGVFFVGSRLVTNVKGVKTEQLETKLGVQLSVVSNNSSWEMLKYLCISESDCLESLDAGRRLPKISGSATELRDISVYPDDSWREFKFLKVYVRSSLNLMNSSFKVLTPGDVPGTTVKTIPFGSANVNVVLVPVEPLFSSYFRSATFSDR